MLANDGIGGQFHSHGGPEDTSIGNHAKTLQGLKTKHEGDELRYVEEEQSKEGCSKHWHNCHRRT